MVDSKNIIKSIQSIHSTNIAPGSGMGQIPNVMIVPKLQLLCNVQKDQLPSNPQIIASVQVQRTLGRFEGMLPQILQKVPILTHGI